MFHKIRNAISLEDRGLLQVEVDEASIGEIWSGKRGHGEEGQKLILIAAEYSGKKGVGSLGVLGVADASAEKLEAFITANVAKGASVHTDGWNGYQGFKNLG